MDSDTSGRISKNNSFDLSHSSHWKAEMFHLVILSCWSSFKNPKRNIWQNYIVQAFHFVRNWNRTLGIQPRVAIQRPHFLYADSTSALITGTYDGYWCIFGTVRNCLRKYSKLSLSNLEQVCKSFWKAVWKWNKEKHPLIRLRFNFQECSAAIYLKKINSEAIWWFYFIGIFTKPFDLRNMFNSQS